MIVTVPHRRTHRRYGIEISAARLNPFFVPVAGLIDSQPQVRSQERFQLHGRSPPFPSIDSRQ